MIGQRFGKLVVLKRVENDKFRRRIFLCQCDCGKTTTAPGCKLRIGHVRSCGCLVWKGEDVDYRAAHYWVTKHKLKPELCERCKRKPARELSYKSSSSNDKSWSRNPDDYEWLCRSCHKLKDCSSGTVMTEARIHRIREFYAVGAGTHRELANLFKVSHTIIRKIVNHQGAYS